MRHAEFRIGETFWCGEQAWRCTDIGTRTIVAIRLDRVEVGSTAPEARRTLSQAAAEAEGWFNGPPYAVAEVVFDEYDMESCSYAPPSGRGARQGRAAIRQLAGGRRTCGR